LQRWFTERLRDWLAERGRQLVGWDEINDEGLLTGAVTMAWRSAEHGVEAALGGVDVVMAPTSHTYFDYYPSAEDTEQYAIGGLVTTEQAYRLEPTEGIPADLHDRILGTQCQIWTEYMPTTRRVEYMLYPRACAHAEVAWSDPADRSWAEFSGRLTGHLERLDALGVNYRPESGPLPWQQGGTGRLRRPDAHRGTAARSVPWVRSTGTGGTDDRAASRAHPGGARGGEPRPGPAARGLRDRLGGVRL